MSPTTHSLNARVARGDTMIDEEERFRAGEYKKHFNDESPCRGHCMGHLLSSSKLHRFAKIVTTVAPTGRELLRASQ